MTQAAKIEINPTDALTEVATATTSAADTPAVAVLFRNGKDTPRGAWFPADSRDAAIAGAAEMGMHAIQANTPEIIDLTLKLPKGRVFESGKLFAPLIQAKVFENLMTYFPEHGIAAKPRLVMSAAPTGTSSGGADVQSASDSVPEGTRPTDWSKITVGSLVLAVDDPDDGWFEALVVEVRDRDMFRLRWRDYPDELLFTRHRSRLALMMQVDTQTAA